MLSRMIEEDMLEKIDLSKIPNAKYIEDRFMGNDYDPTMTILFLTCGAP